MSGGSFNYLCWKVGDAQELANHRTGLREMADELERRGHLETARATRDVLTFLWAAEQASEPLEDVWHAVEWEMSGDGHKGQIEEAIAEFKRWPPASPGIGQVV